MTKKQRNGPTKKRAERWICAAAAICFLAVAAVIFVLSAQPAEQSQTFTNAVLQTLEKNSLETLTPSICGYDLYGSVRKWGHIDLYALLGVSAGCFAGTLYAEKHPKMAVRLSLAAGACVLYALSDELHQSFVPGRECALRDVGFDTVGILAGILLSAALLALCRALVRRLAAKAQK